jgi:tetratricopeptide (TPR) repeat protein/DNA-binding CsgD family transcriptional regulator
MRLLLIVFCFISLAATAGPAVIPASLEEPNGRLWLDHFYDSVQVLKNVDTVRQMLQQAEQLFKQQNKPVLQQACWYYDLLLKIWHQVPNEEVQINYENAIKLARDRKWMTMVSELLLYQGYAYFLSSKIGPGFEQMVRAYNDMKNYGFDKYPWLQRYCVLLTDCYYKMGDMEGVVRYTKDYESGPDYWLPYNERYIFRNTLALSFRQMNQLDSAARYFQLAYESAKAKKDSFWMGLTLGNLGSVYYAQKQYAKALPYLQYDFRESRRFNETGSMINAAVALADSWFQLGEAGKARALAAAISPSGRNDIGPQTMRQWFTLLFNLAKLDGRPADANRFADSALFYSKLFTDNRTRDLALRVKNKLEVEEYINSIKVLNEQRKTEKVIRNALMAGIVLLAIIGLILVNHYRLRRKRELAEAGKERRLAEERLEQTKKDLEQFAVRLREKAALVERFEQEMEQMRGKEAALSQQETAVLGHLMQATILTDEEWANFKMLFEKVHPGFLGRLRQKLPDLTPAETRLLVLTKLPLTPREMTTTLGITYEAIRKTRQRLRKKLQLPEEGSLEELIALI